MPATPGRPPRRRGRGCARPIRRDLPLARGLDFTAYVPARALTREEITGVVRNEIEQSFPQGDVERTQAVYERLGLVPRGADLQAGLQRLYEQEGAGFSHPPM